MAVMAPVKRERLKRFLFCCICLGDDQRTAIGQCAAQYSIETLLLFMVLFMKILSAKKIA